MRKTLANLLLAFLVLVSTTLAPRAALAVGSVQLVSREPVEDDGKWKLQFTLDHGGPPPVAYVPTLFVFTPVVLYERSLTDKTGDKPIINRIPLQNQQAINESLDVGFSDATGKIFAKTKFNFVIRRDRGFEAGEYELKIKRAGDGVQFGQTIKLVLKGDNPVVDRRAMVFAGEKAKKKPDGDKPAAPPGENKEADKTPEPPPGGWEPKPDSAAAPPPVDPKQGGCGCRVGTAEPAPLAFLFAAVAALALTRRRRRSNE